MDFGRLPSVDGVDFELPADDPVVRDVLQGQRAPHARVRIGTPRFADAGFAGTLYPARVRAADQLRLKPGRGLRVDARAYDAGRRAADAVPLAPGRRR